MSYNEGIEFSSDNNMNFMEVSAKDNLNMDTLWGNILRDIEEKKLKLENMWIIIKIYRFILVLYFILDLDK